MTLTSGRGGQGGEDAGTRRDRRHVDELAEQVHDLRDEGNLRSAQDRVQPGGSEPSAAGEA